MLRRRQFSLGLALLLAGALAIRLYGIDHGFPSLVEGDERPVCKNAVRFLVLGTLEPEHFNYPELYSYLFGGALALYYQFGGLWQLGDAGSSAGFTWFFRPTEIALVGRLVSLLLGAMTVVVTWLVGRRAYDDKVAIGGALFAAFSTVLVHQSRLALPDVAMAFFIQTACLFLLRVATRGDLASYLLAGLFIGLATSTKYNGGMLVFGLLGSHLTLLRARLRLKSILSLPLLAGGGTVLLGFLLGSPYWISHFDHYVRALAYEQANMQFSLGQTSLWLWPLISGLVSTEMVWGILGLAGCGYAFYRRTTSDLVMLWILLPTLLYVGTWPKSSLHYILFLLPLLGILGARLVFATTMDLTRWGLVGLIAVTLPNVWTGITAGQSLSGEDLRLQAARWIESNIPAGAVVGVYNYDHAPPLKTVNVEMNILNEMLHTQRERADVVAHLRELKAGTRFYEWVDLEHSLDHVHIPPEYEGKVDVTNAKTRSIFSRDYLSYAEMKDRGVSFVVLPGGAFARYFDDHLEPPAGTAEHYHYTRNRSYISRILSSSEGTFELVAEFGPAAEPATRKISIFRVQ